ncbi:MAG: hypothetical protein ABI045_01590 [Flavobacteriales bacterium]
MDANQSIQNTKGEFLGLPKILLYGHIAVVFFITGDGIEQAFLSSYIISMNSASLLVGY